MKVIGHGSRYDVLDWLIANVGPVLTDVSRYKVIGNGWTFEPKPKLSWYGVEFTGWEVEFVDEKMATLFRLRWS